MPMRNSMRFSGMKSALRIVIARWRRGIKKAIVALARRLADGTEFRWTREQAAAA